MTAHHPFRVTLRSVLTASEPGVVCLGKVTSMSSQGDDVLARWLTFLIKAL